MQEVLGTWHRRAGSSLSLFLSPNGSDVRGWKQIRGGDGLRHALQIVMNTMLQNQASEMVFLKEVNYFCSPLTLQSTGVFNMGHQSPGKAHVGTNCYHPDQGQSGSRWETQVHLLSPVCQGATHITLWQESQELFSEWHGRWHFQPTLGTTTAALPTKPPASMLVSACSHPGMSSWERSSVILFYNNL